MSSNEYKECKKELLFNFSKEKLKKNATFLYHLLTCGLIIYLIFCLTNNLSC